MNHDNSHNKAGRQLQFISEVTLIGAHIMSKLQPNPTIIARVIANFVHSNIFQDHFLSRPLCAKLYQNSAIWQFLSRPSIWSTFRSYFTFFQNHCPNFTPFKTIFGTSFKTITFSLILGQWWQDSSYSNHPSLTGTQTTNRQHSRNGRVIWHSHWKPPTFPKKDGMPASLVSWALKASKRWQHLEISKQDEQKKIPENVFKAFADTLEVSTSYWNHIDEMYSDIRQGKQETTNQVDQCIKILVKKCSYMTDDEKKQHWLELLFHVTMKHFEVKKSVRSQTAQKETVTFNKLLQHAKQHEAIIKDFTWHKFNRGVAMATTIDEIRTFKHRKGQGHRAKGSQGKTCSKCGMSHPPRECPAWGKKCHKCGNKKSF